MALLQGKLGGDVAHEDVEDPVAVQVAEVDPHPLEGVAADDLGIGRGQGLLTFQQGEAELTRPGPVVEQPVGPEVVGEVELGQEVAIEISRPDPQGPTVAPQVVQHPFVILESDTWLRPSGAFDPAEEVLPPAVVGPGHRVLHRLQPPGPGVEDPGVVGKIVADDQVGMTVAIEVGQRGGIGEPAAGSRRDLLSAKRTPHQPGVSVVPPEEHDWRTAPVIDQDVHQAVLVQVARQAAHGGHRVGIIGQRNQAQAERLVSLARAGDRRDDHPVGPRIHINHVVRADRLRPDR